MWFITLVVLAIGAYLAIKAFKAQSIRKTTGEQESSPATGLQGNLKRDASSQDLTDSPSTANDSAQPNTIATGNPDADGQASAPVTATSRVIAAGNGQDESREIQEMIKILNLAEADAGRLGISAEQFNALRTADSADEDTTAMPSPEAQADIADRLRRMLA